jgi:hypothetical protein
MRAPSPAAARAASAGLRVVNIDVDEVARHPDLLAQAHRGPIDLVIVRRVFDPSFAATVVERLESGAISFPTTELPPKGAGRLLGHVLDLTFDLEAYFADAEWSERGCRELFAGGPAFEARTHEVLTPMASGRRVTRMTHGDGRPYLVASIRNLGVGGHVRMHCEDQKLVEEPKRRILETATPHVSSFYLMLAPAEAGGELVLYDATWDSLEAGGHNVRGRVDPEWVRRNCQAYGYRPRVGELLLFGNARIHEVTPVRAGSRWAIGGFFTFGLDGASVYTFS